MRISASFTNAYEFACNSKACAPPPAGRGGSIGKTPTQGSPAWKRARAAKAAEPKRDWAGFPMKSGGAPRATKAKWGLAK